MSTPENQIDSGVKNLINLNHDGDAKPINVMQDKVRITVDEWGARARDKTECYNLLAHEYGAYLPHIDCVTMWYLRDLAAGKKRRLKGQR